MYKYSIILYISDDKIFLDLPASSPLSPPPSPITSLAM